MWDLPGLGLDPMSPALAGRFLTTVPPGKSLVLYLDFFFNLCLAELGLYCCAGAFSTCGEQRLLFIAVRGLLIAVASLVVEHGL